MIPSGRGHIGSILASELAGTNDGGSMLEQEELWPALGGTLSISFEVRERKNFCLAPDNIGSKVLLYLLDAVQLITFKGKLRVDKLSGLLKPSNMGENHNENNAYTKDPYPIVMPQTPLVARLKIRYTTEQIPQPTLNARVYLMYSTPF